VPYHEVAVPHCLTDIDLFLGEKRLLYRLGGIVKERFSILGEDRPVSPFSKRRIPNVFLWSRVVSETPEGERPTRLSNFTFGLRIDFLGATSSPETIPVSTLYL
jgi:hypothetical protein